ncbi:MAG TPA: NAD(P)-dependent alcohol dehydrogenase [Thermoanaerobaculia bacterium]|jgi:NADPH:quinone reductase-like Zn-dependent oxidoreductase
MKAIAYHRYGSPDVLRCEEIARPVPEDDEVLIAVRAASANPLDWHFLRGTPYIGRLRFGLRKPKAPRLGADVAGRVEAAGGNVTQFKPGDEVFGACCGAFAEYACAPESTLALKPQNVTFEQAAAAPVAGLTALQALRDKGRLQPGQTVLINGAAGGVGTFAVQIAKWLGADVTGVCSARNVERVRSIGADWVIDYTQEDFTRSGQHYDLILDCVGNHSLPACRRVLNPQGIYVIVGAPDGRWISPLPRVLQALVMSRLGSQSLVLFLTRRSQKDLIILRDLMAAGKVTPVIDRCYGLDEVPEAIRYLEGGHARGKVIITV